jgi:tRNA(Ile)-lysidine synthase
MAPREGRVIRPLLSVTREDTARHCSERALAWREDPTNDEPAYARNRIRAGLAEELRRVHPAAEANVVRTAELLREEAEVLDELVATVLDGREEIAIDHVAVLPRALARLVVRRLAEDAVGGLCPRAAGRLGEILTLGGAARDGAPRPASAALDLGDGVRAVVEQGMLRMVPTPPLKARA